MCEVRLQTQSDLQPLQFRGPLDCFRQTFHNEGLFGFYRVRSFYPCTNNRASLHRCSEQWPKMRPCSSPTIALKSFSNRPTFSSHRQIPMLCRLQDLSLQEGFPAHVHLTSSHPSNSLNANSK